MEIYKQCVEEHDEEFANCVILNCKLNPIVLITKNLQKNKVLKVQILYILMKPPFKY